MIGSIFKAKGLGSRFGIWGVMFLRLIIQGIGLKV
jgi:hypothetical protein